MPAPPPTTPPASGHRPGARVAVDVSGVPVGAGAFAIIAGPCAVEGRDQLLETARAVHAGGATHLRGGAFKPRTSPHSFQGLGRAALELLAEAREATGLPVVTELLDPAHAHDVGAVADLVQVGARSMHSVPILVAAAELGRPVLLKRAPAATVDEWLAAAEYVFEAGNPHVILCERGIRTFEHSTRYTLDLSAVAVARQRTHLPIVVDPSHAAGDAALVPDLARAAVGVGADGVILEVHPDPEHALSDGRQALLPSDFARLVGDIEALVVARGPHAVQPLA